VFRGFNLDVPEVLLEKYVAVGAELKAANQRIVADKIESFQDENKHLIASAMTAEWFPEIKAQVFISHAHKDSQIAKGLAGFLYNCGISSFIDSTAWGYSDDLLGLIDGAFCRNRFNNNYNYQKRNRSTAHVHMMLSVALSQMINACECVIFLNTPHSISSRGYVEGETTDSPWIYAEISMTSLIQKRPKEAHRLKKALSNESLASDASMTIKYDVDLNHLTKMDANSFQSWVRAIGRNPNINALDLLYDL
jgi:hypothetical protein